MVEVRNIDEHVPVFRNPTDRVDISNPMEFTGVVTVQKFSTKSTSITASSDGTGTGTIPEGAAFVTVDNDGDVNNIVILPEAVPGRIVYLATALDDAPTKTAGYELRSDTPLTVAINGGVGANAESAIDSVTPLVRCVAVTASWFCEGYGTTGSASPIEAAA